MINWKRFTQATLLLLITGTSTMAQQLIPNGYYVITNGNGKSLNVRDTSYEDGTIVQTFNRSLSNNQEWALEPINTGITTYYYIKSRRSGKVLDLDTGTGKVQQYAQGTGFNQQWIVQPSGNYYYIVNRATNTSATVKALEVQNAVTTAHGVIHEGIYTGAANQLWLMNPTNLIGGVQYYEFVLSNTVNLSTPMALDVYNSTYESGTDIQQATYNHLTCQQWLVQLDPTTGYYSIKSRRATNLGLDIEGASTANGGRLQLYSYGGFSNQQFDIQPNMFYSGRFTIRASNATNEFIRPVNNSVNEFATLEQWQAIHDAQSQSWSFNLISDSELNNTVNNNRMASPGASTTATSASITPVTTKDKFQVFPNPASDAVSVVLSGGRKVASESLSFSISNAYGIEVRQGAGSQADVADLPAGIYLMRISDGKTTTTQRFVKQ